MLTKSSGGFTLIEMLVVLAISLILSGLAITYSGIGRNEIQLSIEASKISQAILEAKELSLATYTASPNGSAEASCGYGVSLDLTSSPQTYSIFAYSPAGAPPCPSNDATTAHLASGIINSGSGSEEQIYTPGTWQIPVGSGVVIETTQDGQPLTDDMQAIIFYPPDPSVFMSHDGTTFTNSPPTQQIYLETTDGKNNVTITVNSQGQVSI